MLPFKRRFFQALSRRGRRVILLHRKLLLELKAWREGPHDLYDVTAGKKLKMRVLGELRNVGFAPRAFRYWLLFEFSSSWSVLDRRGFAVG